MPRSRIDFAAINTAAVATCPGLLQRWFPAGRVTGYEFAIGNLAGDRGDSLKVNLQTGKWADFATGEAGGDLISLYAAIHQLDQGAAACQLAEELGEPVGASLKLASTAAGDERKEDRDWLPIMPPAAPPPREIRHPSLGRPDHVWTYRNGRGEPLFMVCRWNGAGRAGAAALGGKTFLPLAYGIHRGVEGWHFKHVAPPRPLYGLDRLAEHRESDVLIVEGEKAADAAQRLLPNMVAVTWPGGTNAVRHADWTPLRGRRCSIWPDRDRKVWPKGHDRADEEKPVAQQPGMKAAGMVARELQTIGASCVWIVDPPFDVADGWDLADAETEGWNAEKTDAWITEHRRALGAGGQTLVKTGGGVGSSCGGDGGDHDADQSCPVTLLGQRAGAYYYASPSGEIRVLKAREHTMTGITSLFDGDMAWLFAKFPKTNKEGDVVGWLVTKACPWLFRECARRGQFDPGRCLRGAGTWRGSNGDLIIHCGDAVWIEGAFHPAGIVVDGIIYPASVPEPRPATDQEGRLAPGPASDAQALLDHLEMWAWRNPPGAARLALGWMMASTVCGALRWRPHIWVTGDQGTGKSTLEELIEEVLGRGAVWRASDPTEAGIRQGLAGAARPVLLDEIEARAGSCRVNQVVELARLASTDSQGAVVRGSAEGLARSWHIRGCFYFTSMLTAPLKPQDKKRICVIDLDPLPLTDDLTAARRALKQGLKQCSAAGPGLRARMVAGWGRFQANMDTYDQALAGLGYSARHADQLGTLLAAADTALYDDPISMDHAVRMVESAGLEQYVADVSDANHFECLVHLLTSILPVDLAAGGTRRLTIGEIAPKAFTTPYYHDELRRHGLAVREPDSGEFAGHRFLLVAKRHRGLEAIFEGTDWAGKGVWAQALRRLPGALTPRVMVSFSGIKERAIWIPFRLLDTDEGESE